MLPVTSFDPRRGVGDVAYKALAHPLAAEAMPRLYRRLAEAARGSAGIALYDPVGSQPGGQSGGIAMLDALHPLGDLPIEGVYVQDVRDVGSFRLGQAARPVTDLARAGVGAVLVTVHDAAHSVAQLAPWVPSGALVASLDEAGLPPALQSNPAWLLDPLNYATNFALFLEADGLSTRLVTANYWAGYGARAVLLWLRLFDTEGRVLATWEEALPEGPGGIVLDSREIRARFDLPDFEGHLFLHAIGAAGHDAVKYSLELVSAQGEASLGITHDATPWPAKHYAGIPAPAEGEEVRIWLENPHPLHVPPGALGIRVMGAGEAVPIRNGVPPFGLRAVDPVRVLGRIAWPQQLELDAGNHLVRPRYTVRRGVRLRVAHANVERVDLAPDPAIPLLGEFMGRGHLLPFPVIDPARVEITVLPTPMATRQAELPLAIEIFDPEGRRVAEQVLGRLPRGEIPAIALDALLGPVARRALARGGHAELRYDFSSGGEADGCLHALFRYADRETGHVTETSSGAHVFNTIMTYRGAPPGLSTSLFLPLGVPGFRRFAVLIHPRSRLGEAETRASETRLLLHDAAGAVVAEAPLAIPAGGSRQLWPEAAFDERAIAGAGTRGYVLVRDATCRLVGYHGLAGTGPAGGFALDHMFGF